MQQLCCQAAGVGCHAAMPLQVRASVAWDEGQRSLLQGCGEDRLAPKQPGLTVLSLATSWRLARWCLHAHAWPIRSAFTPPQKGPLPHPKSRLPRQLRRTLHYLGCTLVAPPNPLASPTPASLSGCCLSSLTPSVIVSVLMRLPKSPRDGRQFFRVLLFLSQVACFLAAFSPHPWGPSGGGACLTAAQSPPRGSL